MLVFNVIFKCRPGMRETFLEKVKAAGIDAASRAEAGNLAYDYYLSLANPDDLLLIEKYTDNDAVMSHVRQPHTAKLVELQKDCVLDVAMERFEGEPWKPEMK